MVNFMYNKVLRFKHWYELRFSKILPWWAFLPLVGCFVLNAFVYWITQILMAGAYHYDFTLPIDRKVPVIPGWISIYILSYAFWAINYIVIARQNRRTCYRLAFADYFSKIVCGVFFIIIPTTNVRPEVIGSGVWEFLLKFIYIMDSPTNLFPSIHCLVSWFCAIGLRGTRVPTWYKVFSYAFAIAVCISTQLTKQHYIVDVFGGIALAEISLLIGEYFVRRKNFT